MWLPVLSAYPGITLLFTIYDMLSSKYLLQLAVTTCLCLLIDMSNFLQVNTAAEVIYDLVDPSANLIFGAVIDKSLSNQVSWIEPKTTQASHVFF